ncbi:AmmeMemoRadiSam system protein B [Candidatus Omnitrophota bacterium]
MENVNFVQWRLMVSGNRSIIVCTVVFMMVVSACGVQADDVKLPNVSGTFYSSNKKKLSDQIDTFLKKAAVAELNEKPIALISPHAGYVYSGQVAANGYKVVQARGYKTVVVLAPSHFVDFKGLSVWPKGAFRTPLGDIEIDVLFAARLIAASEDITFFADAFEKEHSLEVQIPFVQKTLGGAKLVPIVISPSATLAECRNFASILNDAVGNRDDVLVIASTDLSHFHHYNEAKEIDSQTIACIANFQVNDLWVESLSGKAELCGSRPVATTLLYSQLRNADAVRVLNYANSGDVTADMSRVVGYLSAVIYKGDQKGDEEMFSLQQKKQLLKIARDSLETYIREKKRIKPQTQDKALMQESGAFVTLEKKGQLRGCIGRVVGDTPLYQVVADYAVEAGVNDPRFPAVKEAELKDIKLEISVMTPLEKIDDVSVIEVGKHGIVMRQGFNSGLLLPQVATEYGWNRETFLQHTCQKAGLPMDCWKDKSTQIFIFSAEVFSEESIKEE